MKLCSAESPSVSVAVTVTVAVPFAIAVTVTTLPDTETLATAGLDDVAACASASPSGSSKWLATSTSAVLSTATSMSSTSPTATGARLGTVTWKDCSAESPSVSVAVTEIVTVPFATPVTITTLPDTETLATSGLDEVAAYASASPSGSSKWAATSTSAALSTATSISSTSPTATGARLGTVTWKDCSAESPSVSVAVTVTVAAPFVTAVTLNTLPETETVAMAGLDEVAAYASASPSGSSKRAATSTSAVLSTATSMSSTWPTAVGVRFGTVTWKLRSAESSPGSLAVTVTVTAPLATAVTVTTLPAISTPATLASDDVAEYASACPSGSVKYEETSVASDSPTEIVAGAMVPIGCGARFGTTTSKFCWPSIPPGSRAFRVIDALPGETAVTVTFVPEMETVVTPLFDETAE